MILYDRLWETMKAKGMTQYRLIHYYKFSAGQLGRLRKNAYVSTHTIHVLCTILNCSVEDVMEFRKEEAKKEEYDKKERRTIIIKNKKKTYGFWKSDDIKNVGQARFIMNQANSIISFV